MEFANTAICEIKPVSYHTPLDYKGTTFELKLPFTVRRPIRFRSPPDRIPFAARSDSVRSTAI